MATKKSIPTKTASKSSEKTATGKVTTVKCQIAKLNYFEEAYKFSDARQTDKIHPRKIVPKIRKGRKIIDMTQTMPMAFEESVPVATLAMAMANPRTPNDTVTLMQNVQLNDVATSDTASHVCEPSAAMNKDVVFYTGNWFAAVSTDGGATFKYVDPYSSFPNPVGMQFCCDQVVHYCESIDTFFWLLQYGADNSGKNIQRIAYAKTAQVKTGSWQFFDITPASVGMASGIWMDFPDLAVGKNMLYMTTNCFKGNNWRASVVVRIKLTSFSTGNLTASFFSSKTHFSLKVAQNCNTTAYFCSHNSTSSLRLFSWKETAAAPTFNDLNVATWSESVYSSTTPDGRDWLKRADSRLFGATLTNNEVWFAWGSAKGGANNRPQAFTQIARINATTLALIENINLWDPNSAIFYAALATNAENEVGVSFTIGGGTRYPTHVVGILTGNRRQVTTFTSNRGPSDNKWGDYLAVRRCYPSQNLFCATGYTVLSGSGSSDATPNYTVFGRSTSVNALPKSRTVAKKKSK